MEADEKSDKEGCIAFLLLLALMLPAVFYQGWALWLLWNWFAVPLAPAITWKAAVGIALLVGFLKQRAEGGSKTPTEVLHQFMVLMLAILFSVSIGWALHSIGFGAQ